MKIWNLEFSSLLWFKIKPMKKLLTLVFAITLFTACSSDDPKTTLDGNWKLRRVENFGGTVHQFTGTEVQWKFDIDDETFIVTGDTDDARDQALPGGLYTYQIGETENEAVTCSKSIWVDDIDFGCYSLQGQRLKIGTVDAGGYEITLER
jgi:hypothetical protein